MTDLYDQLGSRAPQVREADAFSRLTDVLRGAICAPAYAHRLKDIDPEPITDRKGLAGLPLLRKSHPSDVQSSSRPFGC